MSRSRPWALGALAALLALTAPRLAAACATCYGAADSSLTAGMNNGIMTLLIVVAVVQVGLVSLFLKVRNHARRLQLRREQFELIDGGVNR